MWLIGASLLLATCSSSSEVGDPDGDGLFPDVVGVAAKQAADGSWTFDVTLSSPYDSPDRYADAWRVLGPDGTELGIRELLHGHANEQPFTRSLSGVTIPAGVTVVTVEGKDQFNGWGGEAVEVKLVPE
jgi:hypothetical protein